MTTNKILYANTCNMSGTDNDMLRDQARLQRTSTVESKGTEFPLLVLDTVYGWIVSTWHDPNDEIWTDPRTGRQVTVCQALEAWGFGYGFISVVRHAIASGCRWCEFDADAVSLEGFERYEW